MRTAVVKDTFFGNVFTLASPSMMSGSRMTKYALAISDADSSGDIEFLLLTVEATPGVDHILPLSPCDYQGGGLPAESVLHLGKRYFYHYSHVQKLQIRMNKAFMENVMRSLLRREITHFYQYIHEPRQHLPFRPGKTKITYAGRVYNEKEIINLVDSALDFWLTAGRYARKFEEEFAKFLGITHCSLTNSGSSANLLAFMALTSPKLGERRIRKGDEVITVAAGFPTTVAPIIQYGAIPVFLDITLPTYNVNCDLLEKALSPRSKAVFLAHTLGNPFDIERVMDFCQKHKLWLIEDNCDALGSRYGSIDPRYTGTFGHLSTFSFYPAHHITMGEGGAVCTHDTELKDIIDSFRDWGRDCRCASGIDNKCRNRFSQQFGNLPFGYDHKYIYSHLGYNLKLTDMQAAIGCAQLERISDFIKFRRDNFKFLYEGLKDLETYFILPEATPDSDPSWFGFLLTVRENVGFTRDEVVRHLEENNIQTRMLFSGNVTRHPCFDELRATGKGYRLVSEYSLSSYPSDSLPITDRIMYDTFWIGVYPGMSEGMLHFIVDKLYKICKR